MLLCLKYVVIINATLGCARCKSFLFCWKFWFVCIYVVVFILVNISLIGRSNKNKVSYWSMTKTKTIISSKYWQPNQLEVSKILARSTPLEINLTNVNICSVHYKADFFLLLISPVSCWNALFHRCAFKLRVRAVSRWAVQLEDNERFIY